MQARPTNIILTLSGDSGRRIRLFLKVLIAIFICLSVPVSSYSQSDSLDRYLEIAATNNPVVRQRFSEYEASLQRIPQVGSLPDPELSLGVFLKPMELINGNQVADLRLMQMFPWFGVLKSARDEMSLMARAKFEIFRDAKLQAFYDVQRTWYELYKVQKEISISEKNIEILKIIERLALVRFRSAPSENSGTSSENASGSSLPGQKSDQGSSIMQSMGGDKTSSIPAGSAQTSSSMSSSTMSSSSGNYGLQDIYRIQIESGDLENNIAMLRNQQSTITAQFNSYLNRPAESPVFINDSITMDDQGVSLIAVSDSMLLNNPMLGMISFEKQSIDARGRMVKRMGYPMVGLGLNYSLVNKTNSGMATPEMNGKDMMMPMITLTLPVYRKKYNAMKTEAELLQTAAAQNYQAASNALQTEFYQAVQLYQDAQRRIKLYQNQFNLASKSLELMLRNFTVSSTGLTDVLRIRQQTLDYEFKQIEAIADYNTAVAWLKRLGSYNIEL